MKYNLKIITIENNTLLSRRRHKGCIKRAAKSMCLLRQYVLYKVIKHKGKITKIEKNGKIRRTK